MTYKLNFPRKPDAALIAMSHPTYGIVRREVTIEEGDLTPWMDYWFGWQLKVVATENNGKTLVMEAQRPIALDKEQDEEA